MEKKRVLSGIRPTGKLHLGHWVGVLSNWVNLQDKYQCFFMVADWHALMSEYKSSREIKETIIDNVADWLAWGIDYKKSTIFVQSEVKEHLELFMMLSVITPLGWLFRCPTFKEQLVQLKDKEINTYAFLGYPVLQAADILLYKAHYVPVGEDQLPHLELTREIARRFHFIYNCEIFVEPQDILTPTPKFLGVDGRKMSKSYNNYISLDEELTSIETKVLSMFTDPSRIKNTDRGHPDICNVFSYYKVFAPKIIEEVRDWCSNAKRGCKDCKKMMAGILTEFMGERSRKKRELLKDKDIVISILEEGNRKAGNFASLTMKEVKEVVMGKL
ncbi:MAG: tryptophan--tRNA ligase [Candidatus Omnitrophica bacterium]|nr:tryptophan--tRNA ligase [Candidatus Omnitrophota bacterium]